MISAISASYPLPAESTAGRGQFHAASYPFAYAGDQSAADVERPSKLMRDALVDDVLDSVDEIA